MTRRSVSRSISTEEKVAQVVGVINDNLSKEASNRHFNFNGLNQLASAPDLNALITQTIDQINSRRIDFKFSDTLNNEHYRVMLNKGEMANTLEDYVEHALRYFAGAANILQHTPKIAESHKKALFNLLKKDLQHFLSEIQTLSQRPNPNSAENLAAVHEKTNVFDAVIAHHLGKPLNPNEKDDKTLKKTNKEISLSASMLLAAHEHADIIVTQVNVQNQSFYLASIEKTKTIADPNAYKTEKWFTELQKKFSWVASFYEKEPNAQTATVCSGVLDTNNIRNARRDMLFVRDESGEPKCLDASTRSAIIIPIGIKDHAERIRVAKDNLANIIQSDINYTFSRFLDNYGALILADKSNSRVPFTHVYQTLLTPIALPGKPALEYEALQQKEEVIALLQQDAQFKKSTEELMQKTFDNWAKNQGIAANNQFVSSHVDLQVRGTNNPNNAFRGIGRNRSSQEIADSRALAENDGFALLELFKTKFPDQAAGITRIQNYLRTNDVKAYWVPDELKQHVTNLNNAISNSDATAEQKSTWLKIADSAILLKQRNAETPVGEVRRKVDEAGGLLARAATAVLAVPATLGHHAYKHLPDTSDKRERADAEMALCASRNDGCKSANDRGGTMKLHEATLKIAEFLQIEPTKENINDIYLTLRRSPHAAMIVAATNGTPALKDDRIDDEVYKAVYAIGDELENKNRAAKIRYEGHFTDPDALLKKVKQFEQNMVAMPAEKIKATSPLLYSKAGQEAANQSKRQPDVAEQKVDAGPSLRKKLH